MFCRCTTRYRHASHQWTKRGSLLKRPAHPILLRLPLRPLARRQTVVVEVFVSIVLEPDCTAISQGFGTAYAGEWRLRVIVTIIYRLGSTPFLGDKGAFREILE
jgi:hypothetical protein